MSLALYALALAAFAIGTAEFIIAGLLPTIASDLSVSIPAAGLLVSGYAIGVAIGGPILALATAHMPRRAMILWMVGLYALGHVLCAIAPNYLVLLAARVLVALTHGLFFGNATIAAAAVVPYERRGAAIAVVLAGVPVANVLGVPFGAAIGHWLGWRASFWGVAILAAAAFAAIALTLPRIKEEKADPIPWHTQVKGLFRHQIALSYLALFALMTGALAFNTYQVPFLINMTGLPEASTPPYLFAYGAGAVAGIVLGGRLADWKLVPSTIGAALAYAAISAAILLGMQSPAAMFVLMVSLGVAVWAFSVPPQTRIVHSSQGSGTVAATFTATAFNLGYTLGAAIGAVLLTVRLGYPSLPIVGIGGGLLAAAVTFWSSRLDRAR